MRVSSGRPRRQVRLSAIVRKSASYHATQSLSTKKIKQLEKHKMQLKYPSEYRATRTSVSLNCFAPTHHTTNLPQLQETLPMADLTHHPQKSGEICSSDR
jgi:hypothetical protein